MTSNKTSSSTSAPLSPPSTTRNQFSTFGGVFTPSILTILGVIMFMRAGFVTGEAGIIWAVIILILAKTITSLTALSIGAISSNMQVRGGGAYFLISRVLGPEFGGAIGLALFLAQALSVPFYILGFTEAIVTSFPEYAPYFLYIGITAAFLLFVIAFISANLAIKTQYFILAVLVGSIITFMGGAFLDFNLDRFYRNLSSGYTEVVGGEGKYNFWLIFAIYFPAVTGILAGVNMSGDLKDPARSIPKGTLYAIGVGFLVYLVEFVSLGGAYERSELITDPFRILERNAIFGMGFMVMAGMFAASLSSALGSYLGAPRILQAVARDDILQVLHPFAKGTTKGDEPRRALMLTGLMTLGVLIWAGDGTGGAAFNIVANSLTMIFLYTYGMINVAAFIEAIGANPSFRPRFKYFHWITALLGAIGCVGSAFLINPVLATGSFIFIVLLLIYLSKKSLESDFADARRGFVYSSVRRNLLRLKKMEEDPRNWRPIILVFSGNPSSREALVSYAVWLEAGRGIVFFGNILVGDLHKYKLHRESAIKQLNKFCDEKGIQAFPQVIIANSVEEGVSHMLQVVGMGPIHPNLIVFGWSSEKKGLNRFINNLRTAAFMNKSLVLIRGNAIPKVKEKKRVDIWWRGRKNGELMMILSHLLQHNWEWMRTRIRVLRVVDREAGYEPAHESLEKLIEAARIEAEIKVIVSEEKFKDILREHSRDATCLFLGFEVPEKEEAEAWHRQYEEKLEGMPTTILVSSAGREDMMA